MIKFKDFINEKSKLLGSLKKHEKILYNSYIEFLKDYYKVNIDIEISFRKPNPSRWFWGWIDLIGLRDGKYKIVVQKVPSGLLTRIAHEFTHIKQYIKGELRFTDDHKTFLWKGKESLTIKEYNAIKNFEEYKKVPWEADAYKMQDKLVPLYLKSKFFEDIKGKDVNLDYLIDNDALN